MTIDKWKIKGGTNQRLILRCHLGPQDQVFSSPAIAQTADVENLIQDDYLEEKFTTHEKSHTKTQQKQFPHETNTPPQRKLLPPSYSFLPIVKERIVQWHLNWTF